MVGAASKAAAPRKAEHKRSRSLEAAVREKRHERRASSEDGVGRPRRQTQQAVKEEVVTVKAELADDRGEQ